MILLDTHALIWWVTGNSTIAYSIRRHSGRTGRRRHRGVVDQRMRNAMLVNGGRLALAMDVAEWLAVVEEIEAVRFVPVDNEIAVKSTTLPGEFHKDPADRIIVATARKLAAPLVTADERIRAYQHVRTIW